MFPPHSPPPPPPTAFDRSDLLSRAFPVTRPPCQGPGSVPQVSRCRPVPRACGIRAMLHAGLPVCLWLLSPRILLRCLVHGSGPGPRRDPCHPAGVDLREEAFGCRWWGLGPIYQAWPGSLLSSGQRGVGRSPSPLGLGGDPVTPAGCWAVSRRDECPPKRKAGADFLHTSPAVPTLESVCPTGCRHTLAWVP